MLSAPSRGPARSSSWATVTPRQRWVLNQPPVQSMVSSRSACGRAARSSYERRKGAAPPSTRSRQAARSIRWRSSPSHCVVGKSLPEKLRSSREPVKRVALVVSGRVAAEVCESAMPATATKPSRIALRRAVKSVLRGLDQCPAACRISGTEMTMPSAEWITRMRTSP